MPVQTQDKCYTQQPKCLPITATMQNDVRDDWQVHFYALLATHLKLNDSEKNYPFYDHKAKEEVLGTERELFFNELNRHVGPESNYSSKPRLLESLKTLYCLFTDPKTTIDQKSMIASRIKEDITQCTPGFDDRVTTILILLNMPQNLDQLLAQARFHLVDRIASSMLANNAQSIHVHNRAVCLANAAGFGIWPINPDDSYLTVGSAHLSDEAIVKNLKKGFDSGFRLFGILNLLGEQIEHLIAAEGYHGNYEKNCGKEYSYGEYSKFSKLINQFVVIDDDYQLLEAVTDDETLVPNVFGINWQNVKLALMKKLISEDYIEFETGKDKEKDKAALLTSLSTLTHHQALTTLISHDHELAACLTMLNKWSVEQKITLVIAYLNDKKLNEQKNILAILENEIPQLTAQLISQPELQQIYFKIAIQENDVAAVKRHIEQGADINIALPLLFGENHKSDTLHWLYENKTLIKSITSATMNSLVTSGKYQGKSIAETLVSTKKGRQLLWENPALAAILPNTLAQDWQGLAKIENHNKITLEGFFKKPHPLAIKLAQHVAYGEMEQAKTLLEENPLLAKKLLAEKVTVTDYSKRKIKKKTAFQIALCALDDEMCEMLANLTHMSKEEMTSQYKEKDIFPEGHQKHYQEQTRFDFSDIINAIDKSNNEEVQTALNLVLPNTTVLWAELEKFRLSFTKHSQQETVFNPQHLIAAFDRYDKKLNDWDLNKRNLFWRQVIGFVQRFFPANLAMDVAQGLHSRIEEKEKSNRSFKFRYADKFIFPLSFDSLCGLGYEYASLAVGGPGRTSASRGPVGWGHSLQNLCRAKMKNLSNLCDLDRKRLSI